MITVKENLMKLGIVILILASALSSGNNTSAKIQPVKAVQNRYDKTQYVDIGNAQYSDRLVFFDGTADTASVVTGSAISGAAITGTLVKGEPSTETKNSDNIDKISDQSRKKPDEKGKTGKDKVTDSNKNSDKDKTISVKKATKPAVKKKPAGKKNIKGRSSNPLTKSKGVVHGPSGKETYYNLDMSGVVQIMKNKGINKRYWVREDGVKMYGDYVMCAANLDVHPRGSLVETSLGTAMVCDTGGFADSNPHALDIATNW